MSQTETKVITKKERLSFYTFGECKTASGQLIQYRCHPDEKEKVKAFLQEYVRDIDIPTNKEHNMSHGGYGRYTRFKITQHKYAGGGSGYIEMLEIHDPPDGRWPYVCLEHNGHYRPGDWFWEFKSLESMLAVWDQWWQRSRCEPDPMDKYVLDKELVRPMKAVKRTVECGFLSPWFYAMGDQIICGDFVIPDMGLCSHPEYTPGRQFVVQHGEEPPVIKTCMCCYKHSKRVWERGGGWGYYDNKEVTKDVYCVVWKDGTQTEIDDGLWTVRPAELGELWITVAFEKFQRVIAGDLLAFEIPFIDGTKFVGRFRPTKKQDLTRPGRYMIQAYFIKKDETKEILRKGTVEFEPSEQVKDVISFIKQQAWQKDFTLSRIESVVYMEKKGWRGFYEKGTRKRERQAED